MKLKHIIKLKKLYNKNINFITIDGIACSGKTSLSIFLKKKFKNTLIISKDLFLLPRNKRIQITKLLQKKNYTQNNIHYDLNKLKALFYFLLDGRKKKNSLKKII